MCKSTTMKYRWKKKLHKKKITNLQKFVDNFSQFESNFLFFACKTNVNIRYSYPFFSLFFVVLRKTSYLLQLMWCYISGE